ARGEQVPVRAPGQRADAEPAIGIDDPVKLEPRGFEDGDLAIRASGGEERAVGAEGEADRTFFLQRNGAGEMPAPRVVKCDGAVRGDGEPLMRGVEREDAREVDRRVLVA